MLLKIKTLFIAAAVVMSMGLDAQNDQKNKNSNSSAASGRQAAYKTGIGLRLGYEAGLSLKHFMGNNAVEGIFSRGWGYGGFRITGLYEWQKPIASVAGLDWFIGVGAHIGFYNGGYYGYRAYGGGYYDKNGNWHPTGYRTNYMTLGIDGILGLEYLFADFPITVGIDIKPYIDLLGWGGGHFADGAITVRYAIK